MKRTGQWYRNRLGKYFNKHFKDKSIDNVEFYPDPSPNKWHFDISDTKGTRTEVILSCDNKGRIIDTRKKH